MFLSYLELIRNVPLKLEFILKIESLVQVLYRYLEPC